MDSKLFISLFLLISSSVFVGMSLDFDAAAASTPACVEKLLACQPYLVAAPPSPPPSCCGPLKEIIDNDIECLCKVFDNAMLMETLNVSKDEALKLPKACGNEFDASFCKTAAATPPGVSETTPSIPTEPISSNISSNSTGNEKSIAANYGISFFGGSSFFPLFVVFEFLSFN